MWWERVAWRAGALVCSMRLATGCVAAGGTLGIVPAGRGNDLARALRLPTTVDGLATRVFEVTWSSIKPATRVSSASSRSKSSGAPDTRWSTGLPTTSPPFPPPMRPSHYQVVYSKDYTPTRACWEEL